MGVVILVSAVVGTVYVYIVPYHMERSYVLCTIYIVVGHWLLANIVFHYYKGVTTKPGAPPKVIRCISGQALVQLDRTEMDSQTGGWIHWWINGWTDRHTDRQADRHADRQNGKFRR